MALQPSGSRTDLLLNCQYPFAEDVETTDEPGEPARYGSAFHELIAELLLLEAMAPPATVAEAIKSDYRVADVRINRLKEKWRLPPSSIEPLPEHVAAAFLVLWKWLRGENPWRKDFILCGEAEIEKAFAVTPRVTLDQTTVRPIGLPTTDSHKYSGLKRGEIPLTLDLKIGDLVLDHKTGHKDFSSPSDLGQMLTAALVPAAGFKEKPAPIIVAVLDADRRGIPAVYAEQVGRERLQTHAKKLRAALQRIGDGSMRPGHGDTSWCKTCPARDDCPTQNADLIKSAVAVFPAVQLSLQSPEKRAEITTPRDVGALHWFISEYDKLSKAARAEMRAFVVANPTAGAVRPQDGKVLTMVTKKYTNLSQASILRAYGKVKGERVLKKLRTDGAIEEGERLELHALNNE